MALALSSALVRWGCSGDCSEDLVVVYVMPRAFEVSVPSKQHSLGVALKDAVNNPPVLGFEERSFPDDRLSPRHENDVMEVIGGKHASR